MSGSSSMIGRLFQIMLNTSGFLGSCVESNGITFLTGLVLTTIYMPKNIISVYLVYF